MKLKKKLILFINLTLLSLFFSSCGFDIEKSTHDLKYNKPSYIDGVLIVNKGIGLPSNFEPGEDLEAREQFNIMKSDAKSAGLTLRAFSTYRSYDRQKYLYNSYMERDGKEAADSYSARPGFSEHQTGLAFDIGNNNPQNDASMSFENTKEFNWLKENSYKYGFILRYPKDKENITGFSYEPWHYRYVGEETAKEIFSLDITLDEYLNSVYPNYN